MTKIQDCETSTNGDIAQKAICSYLDLKLLVDEMNDYYNFDDIDGVVATARHFGVCPEFDKLVETMAQYPKGSEHTMLFLGSKLDGYLTGAQGLAEVKQPMMPILDDLIRSGNWQVALKKLDQVHGVISRVLAYHVAHR